jgi:hypothetical protein
MACHLARTEGDIVERREMIEWVSLGMGKWKTQLRGTRKAALEYVWAAFGVHRTNNMARGGVSRHINMTKFVGFQVFQCFLYTRCARSPYIHR